MHRQLIGRSGASGMLRKLTSAWARTASSPALHANAFYDDALSAAGIGVWQCELATSALTWTPGVFDLFGISQDAKLDRRETVEMYAESSREEMERLRAEAIRTGRGFSMEAEIVRADGERRWMRLTASTICLGRRPVLLRGTKQDITNERRHYEALRQMAECDAVTGLSNRMIFQTRFLEAAHCSPLLTPLGALVLFDLDGFKQINDRVGHLAGDACLKAAASRLRSGFPEALMIARIGGDEFAVLTKAPEVRAALEYRIRTQLEALAAPIVWQGELLAFSASAGAAVAADVFAYDPEQLFKSADAALYAAKHAGRGTYRVAGAGTTNNQCLAAAPGRWQ